MTGASEAIAGSLLGALQAVEGLNGVYDGRPLTAAWPHATVETGPEIDWSHKSGEGRELRLSIIVRDKGERPARLRAIASSIEAAVAGLGPDLTGWRLINLVFLRATMLRESGAAWAASLDYRARLLKG